MHTVYTSMNNLYTVLNFSHFFNYNSPNTFCRGVAKEGLGGGGSLTFALGKFLSYQKQVKMDGGGGNKEHQVSSSLNVSLI